MGTLKGMPAYYGLKWVSPASINSGGFGNDPDAPLGMLKDGFSTMVTALSMEAQLDIRLQQEVVSVDRTHAAADDGKVIVTTKSKNGAFDTHNCDLVILTGPIPQFIATDHSDAVVNPTAFEKDLLDEKRAMQFMQTLVDMDMRVNVDAEKEDHAEPTKPVSPYKALDYWAAEFSSRGGVIVRRDVGYAETGLQHTIGGLQSYSYHPPPFGANQSEMWTKQKQWLERYGYGTEESGGYEVLGQFYIDTYMFHYEERGIMEGKPWELEKYQGLSSTRTLYVGGAVSFEAMEDVINANLDLIRQKFDESDLFASFS